ncbi:DUF397 domain-containing protein [Actinomadura citrea]|jgi:hypothetical protein|uniref:DUF397 domain-containing protein n=1 Tax=Actinomadura citrea TaxID=46158 RepID=A0A7Y9GAW8_9ACTN|nr:DUF397 domain-containing protein [Actinomadura citrea]NYE13081.1 hypothetical protein [Actinomadura citrea]GGT88573.1 hypothetical protein GCM10010177_54790 [Actinomadura citrea]
MTHTNASAPVWRKSSRSSDPDLAVCVEVASIGSTRAIRDSKDPEGPRLSLSMDSWRSFMDAVKSDALQG